MKYQINPTKTINNETQYLTNDKIIRKAFVQKLEDELEGESNVRIIEELGVTHGAARVDIAVVNGVIHGYELKSDMDTLIRLPYQVKLYSAVLDQVTLVVGKNHVHEAIKIIPEWWGITVAKIIDETQKISFFNIREAVNNENQNNAEIAALLWRDEALNILEDINQAKGFRSKTREVIYRKLAEVLTTEELKTRVRDQLCTRANWRSDL